MAKDQFSAESVEQKQAVAGTRKFLHPIGEYKKQLTLIKGGKDE